MAETSNHRQSIGEPEDPLESPSRERDQWESTELSELEHIRQNYTHASSTHALGPGTLERTFLAYLRTSLALSMLGVSIAQLFRLQHSPTPNPLIGFFVLGKPLACICQGAAITTLLVGSIRSWRHQNAIVRGKALSGGFEVLLIGVGFFLIFLTFLVLLIAVDVIKEHLKSD
ncbi:hypothetical protein H4I96_01918 [Botrytis cinerea]